LDFQGLTPSGPHPAGRVGAQFREARRKNKEDKIEHWRFGMGQGIVGMVAQTGKPIYLGEAKNDSRYIDEGRNISSELAVPLIAKNRTIGVLDIGSRQPHYFTEHHQQLLLFLCGHLANTIENARLYEKVREQARMLSLLHEAGRQLTSILDQEELLAKVAELVKRLIEYQLFCVMIWNEESQLLEHIFSARHDERFCYKGGFPLGYGICGTAAALRQVVRVPNVQLDPRYVRCGHEVEVRSELTAPLVFKDKLIGIIDLESIEYNAFSELHEQILSTLASYIAIAMENARLYKKLGQEEARLERDLATAREIQKGLLPDKAPITPGIEIAFAYEPALQLGGDFYDFLSYGDDSLAIIVGDVSGKGTPAALYGALTVGILRGHVVHHQDEPAEMLKLTNDQLREPRLDNRFAALAFSLYDSRTRTLTLANSGFPRPWLLRGGEVEEIVIDGLPLGILPGSEYEQKTVALEGSDIIVFCSDGLHESMNEQGEELGADRLRALLAKLSDSSAAGIAAELMKASDLHTAGSREYADDRTVVVLKFGSAD